MRTALNSPINSSMERRNLLFPAKVAEVLANHSIHPSVSSEIDQLEAIHSIMNEPRHPLRNQLLRLAVDSSDWLRIIKKEGDA